MKWYVILKEWRITLMVLLVIASIIAIRPNLSPDGVVITDLVSPASTYLKTGEVIAEINNYAIHNMNDFNYALSRINHGDTVNVVYMSGNDRVNAYPFLAIEKENKTVIGISAAPVSYSNIEFGIDLSGGTRVLLSPKEEVTSEDLDNIVGIIEQRMNIYGFKEVRISPISDLSGKKYIEIELPSSTSVSSIEDLLQHQGVFEARIGNTTVFSGDDILRVCVTGSITNSDCQAGIQPTESGYLFMFQVFISDNGSNRFAEVTRNLTRVPGQQCYLSEDISFYLDGEKLEDSDLKISCQLQGVAERKPTITGGAETYEEAGNSMKHLMSMLQTDNLPVEMKIENVEIISPLLGQDFLKNIIEVFFLAILVVDAIIVFKYKNWRLALPIIIATFSEITITLGVATLMHWTFDLSAIAGLIAGIGTGVDDQIIISDEVLRRRGQEEEQLRLKDRIKKAFSVVIVAFIMNMSLMVPLLRAGAGMLRGFATTTIIAVSIGVLITRPAFGRIIELSVKE